MKWLYFKQLYLIGFVLVFLFAGCNNRIRKFKTNNINSGDLKFERYFLKSEISPLKDEWTELYSYLQKGHLLQSRNGEEVRYIYSYQLYQFLKKNLLKIYETPFLQKYEQFISVFGEPERYHDLGSKIMINYIPSVIGDSCETCNHDAFGYVFDKESKELLRE